MKSQWLRFLLLSVLALSVLAFCTSAFAQRETGQITGTVTDPTGAVVSSATVTATSVSTGVERTATTNSTGAYTIAGLKPDTYKVAVEAKGFRKISQNVEVAVGSSSELSVKLEVGDASQVVEVTAAAGAAVNTTDQTLSETITSRQLNELPTSPTRNPYALVGISGNVTEDSGSMRGAGYAVNGMRSASTDILLDGGENVDSFTAGVGQIVPLDSVQEFSVLTNNFTAEYGRASGGVVNVVTKSGTNSFHGSAYEYNRISALSANTYQNDATQTPKGGFTRNDFGFSIGGPIKKNKLFFFNNTEWIRVRSAAPQNFTIIDPASISSLAPASQAFFSQYGHLGPVRTIATGPCATVANSPTCDSIVFSVPTDAGGGAPQNTWMEVGRVDYTITDKTTLFGRYASYKELDFAGFVNSSPYVGYNTGQTNYDQNFEFNIMHVFGPSITNTAKVIFNRLNGPVQPLSTAPVSPTLYTASSVPNVNVGGNNFPLVFPGYNMTGPGLGLPFGGPQNLYEFYDDLAWVRGKHTFKFGGQFTQLRDNRVFGAYENPVELLGKNLNSGITNLMNGEIYQFQGAVYPQGKFPCVNDINTGTPIVTPACTLTLPVSEPRFGRNYRYNDGGLYAQDSWKVVPRLTVNLGVRWEYYGVQHNSNPSLDSNFVMGSGATIFEQIRNGSVQLAKNGGVFWKPQYHNFGPRVGFAWDVFGDGKTALRGGYGISYERNFGNVTFNAIQNPPNYAVISLVNASVNGGVGDVPTLPVYTDTAGPLAGTGSKALPAVSQRAINQNLKSAYAETWNLSVDRQLGAGVLSIAYAGSHGVHGYDIANVNPLGGGGLYLGDAANPGNRLNLQYGNMNFRSDQSYSHYAAVNAKYSVNDLLHKGVGLTANYTWSHALDNLSSTFSDSNGASQSGLYQLGYLDAFNPKLNYGNADFDIRHRLALSGTWELPWMKTGGNAIARNVIGGWALGSIFSVRSGSPFSIYDCTNATQTACPLLAPGQALPTTGSPSPAGINAFNYIALPTYADTTCAPKQTPPCTGPSIVGTSRDGSLDSLGDPNCTGLFHVGCTYTPNGRPYPERNQFFGPHYWNIDMNFYKTFKITERFGIQFRGEFYNIFNHHNQYVNTENLDVSSLSTPFIQTEKGGPYGFPGICTTSGCDERRNIQLGLKFFF
jgi:outer membrane receptor protein involved in Fe transport